jgi:hypothetical protein
VDDATLNIIEVENLEGDEEMAELPGQGLVDDPEPYWNPQEHW